MGLAAAPGSCASVSQILVVGRDGPVSCCHMAERHALLLAKLAHGDNAAELQMRTQVEAQDIGHHWHSVGSRTGRNLLRYWVVCQQCIAGGGDLCQGKGRRHWGAGSGNTTFFQSWGATTNLLSSLTHASTMPDDLHKGAALPLSDILQYPVTRTLR
jgi:hypothetical protein